MCPVTRELTERWESNEAPVWADTRAVHARPADDRHPPSPIGARAQHRERVVPDDRLPRPAEAFHLGRDSAVVERDVGARKAVHP